MALELRLKAAELYGCMDQGHRIWWWGQARKYKQVRDSYVRKGCERALWYMNMTKFNMTYVSPPLDDVKWEVNPRRSKSFTTAIDKKRRLIDLWLEWTADKLAYEHVGTRRSFTCMKHAVADAAALSDAWDDMIYG